MTTLGPKTIGKIIEALPQEVVTAFKTAGVPFYLAGGFIRAIVADEKPADVDLFVSGAADADKLAAFLCSQKERYEAQSSDPVLNSYLGGNERRKATLHRSPNAITIRGLGRPVQIITRWSYTCAEKLVHDFDFTISQACLYWEPAAGFLSVASDSFEDDVLQRRLVYTQPQREEEQAGSLVRLFKFYKKGYTPSLTCLAQVSSRAITGGDDYAALSRALEKAARRLPKAPAPGDHSEDDISIPSPAGFSASSG